MAAAAYRIYSLAAQTEQLDGDVQTVSSDDSLASSSFASSASSSTRPGPVEGPQSFWSALTIKSGLLAFLAKYSALYLSFLFIPGSSADGAGAGSGAAQASAIALSLVLLPTALNILKWKRRSDETTLAVDDVLAM